MKVIKKTIIALSICASTGLYAENFLDGVKENLEEGALSAIEQGLNNAMSKMTNIVSGTKDTFLGIDPAKLLKSQSVGISAGFLEAQCKIPQLDLGNGSGICSRFADGITDSINQLLGNTLGLGGVCEVGTNANVCQDNYLANMCKKVEGTVKDWAGVINSSVNDATAEVKEKIIDMLGGIMSPESSVLVSSSRYSSAFTEPRTTGKQDQCLLGDNSDDAVLYYGEKVGDKEKMLSSIRSAAATSDAGSSAAQAFVMECMKRMPTNDANADNIDKYLEICSPSKYVGQDLPTTKASTVKAASKLSAPTSSSVSQNQQEIKEKANKIIEQCSDAKDTSDIAGCLQKAYENQNENDKASAASRYMESTNTSEYYSALADMLLTYNYTKEKLDKIPNNKRAYAAMQSIKENERNVLILANLQKLQRLREELNTLTENYKNVCAEADAGTIINTQVNMNMIDKTAKEAEKKANDKAQEAINQAGAGGGGMFGGNGGGFENILNQSGQNIVNSLGETGKDFLQQAINAGAQVAGNYIKNAVGEKIAQIDPTGGVISDMAGNVIGQMTSNGIQTLGGDLMAKFGDNNSLDFSPIKNQTNTPNASDTPGGSGTLVTDQGGSGVMGANQAEIDKTLNNNPNLGGGGSLNVGD